MGPSEHWQRALAEGRFLIQRSRADGTHVFPPRVAAPGSGRDDLEWVEPSGLGIVHSVTIVRPRPPADPYNVAIVELDEGVRLMSRVEGLAPEAVAIGLRVQARVAVTEG
ncbi:MAG: Zn-ribbon domain-containing OB-fold protein, partial [Thermaurantiacus sp.]